MEKCQELVTVVHSYIDHTTFIMSFSSIHSQGKHILPNAECSWNDIFREKDKFEFLIFDLAELMENLMNRYKSSQSNYNKKYKTLQFYRNEPFFVRAGSHWMCYSKLDSGERCITILQWMDKKEFHCHCLLKFIKYSYVMCHH